MPHPLSSRGVSPNRHAEYRPLRYRGLLKRTNRSALSTCLGECIGYSKYGVITEGESFSANEESEHSKSLSRSNRSPQDQGSAHACEDTSGAALARPVRPAPMSSRRLSRRVHRRTARNRKEKLPRRKRITTVGGRLLLGDGGSWDCTVSFCSRSSPSRFEPPPVPPPPPPSFFRTPETMSSIRNSMAADCAQPRHGMQRAPAAPKVLEWAPGVWLCSRMYGDTYALDCDWIGQRRLCVGRNRSSNHVTAAYAS